MQNDFFDIATKLLGFMVLGIPIFILSFTIFKKRKESKPNITGAVLWSVGIFIALAVFLLIYGIIKFL